MRRGGVAPRAPQHAPRPVRRHGRRTERNGVYVEARLIARVEAPDADRGARGRRRLVVPAHPVEHRKVALVALVDVVAHEIAEAALALEAFPVALVDGERLGADGRLQTADPCMIAARARGKATHVVVARTGAPVALATAHLAGEEEPRAGRHAGRPAVESLEYGGHDERMSDKGAGAFVGLAPR